MGPDKSYGGTSRAKFNECAGSVIDGLPFSERSAPMIGDMPLIGDTRLLRFQSRIFHGALQEVMFMFRRDPDSGIQRRHPVRKFASGIVVRLKQSASVLQSAVVFNDLGTSQSYLLSIS